MEGLKKFFRKEIILIAVLSLIISVVAVFHWFSNNSIISFVDSYVPIDINASFNYIFFNWVNSVYPGFVNSILGLLLYWVIFFVGSKLSLTVSSTMFALSVLLLFSSLVNFYLLLIHLNKILFAKFKNLSIVSSFLFSILYTFNLYTFFYGYFRFDPNIFLLSFLPLNILALLKIYPLEGNIRLNPKWIFVFFASLFVMIPGFTEYIFLAQYLVWIFLYFCFYVFLKRQKITKFKIGELIAFFLLIIVSQWWWFYSSVLNFLSIYKIGNTITQPFTSAVGNLNLLNSLRLTGISLMLSNFYNWNHFYLTDKWFTLPLFIFPFLLIFLLIKINYFKNRTFIVFLTIVFFVSLFIAKLNNPPFAKLLGLAFSNIPFFNAFRGGDSKAGLYFLFSYMILVYLGFSLLIEFLVKRKMRIYLWFLFGPILIAGIVLTGPFFLFNKDNIRKENFTYEGKKYTLTSKVQIPKEYYDLKKFLEPLCKGKTTIIAPRGGLVTDAIWPKTGSSYMGWDLMPRLMNCSFITYAFEGDAEANNQAAFRILRQNDIEGFKKFLQKNNVGFVLIAKDHVPYWFSTWLYYDPQILNSKLKDDKEFKLIFTNDYLNLYSFTKIKQADYGFNLSPNITEEDFSPTTGMDFASLIKILPSSIELPLFVDKASAEGLKKKIDSFFAVSKCTNCVVSDMGSGVKNFKTFIDIPKDGDYLCKTESFNPDTAIESSSANNSTFTKGIHEVNIKISTNKLASESTIELDPGQYKEIYLGKFKDERYKFSFELVSKKLSGVVFLSQKKLDKKVLDGNIEEGNDILFTMPFSPSDQVQKIERIFTPELFDSNINYLYVKVNNSNSEEKTQIIGLNVEPFVEDEEIKLACLNGINNLKETNAKLSVTEISPVEYKIKISKTNDDEFLIFNNAYNKDWIAYEAGSTKLLKHIKSNFYNAWLIDGGSKNKEIIVEFKRQKQIETNAVITLILFLSGIYIYLKLRKKNEQN